jgi:hypothetical protein
MARAAAFVLCLALASGSATAEQTGDVLPVQATVQDSARRQIKPQPPHDARVEQPAGGIGVKIGDPSTVHSLITPRGGSGATVPKDADKPPTDLPK